MQQPTIQKVTTFLYIASALVVFLALSLYALTLLFLSGTTTSTGLMGVVPSIFDYVPLVGLLYGVRLFYLGATSRRSKRLIWAASGVLLLSILPATTIV